MTKPDTQEKDHEIQERRRYVPTGGGNKDSDVLDGYYCRRCSAQGQTKEEIKDVPCGQVAHKRIRIPFTLAGRNYEAVGFLEEAESDVACDEILRRVPDAVGVDDAIIEVYRSHLPRKLQDYYLLTNLRDPDVPKLVSYFYRSGGWWCKGLKHLGNQLKSQFLVVRRCI